MGIGNRLRRHFLILGNEKVIVRIHRISGGHKGGHLVREHNPAGIVDSFVQLESGKDIEVIRQKNIDLFGRRVHQKIKPGVLREAEAFDVQPCQRVQVLTLEQYLAGKTPVSDPQNARCQGLVERQVADMNLEVGQDGQDGGVVVALAKPEAAVELHPEKRDLGRQVPFEYRLGKIQKSRFVGLPPDGQDGIDVYVFQLFETFP